MINILTICDDMDIDFGDYFIHSILYLYDVVEQEDNITLIEIFSDDCTLDLVEKKLNELNSDLFIFVSYTHGNDSSQSCNGISYANLENTEFYNNSLFYTSACLSGLILGPELVRSGGKAFLGYSNKVWIYFDYQDVFIKCEDYGLKQFIKNGILVNDMKSVMYEKYTLESDKLLEGGIDGIIISAGLIRNRDALVHCGNCELVKEDFDLN